MDKCVFVSLFVMYLELLLVVYNCECVAVIYLYGFIFQLRAQNQVLKKAVVEEQGKYTQLSVSIEATFYIIVDQNKCDAKLAFFSITVIITLYVYLNYILTPKMVNCMLKPHQLSSILCSFLIYSPLCRTYV